MNTNQMSQNAMKVFRNLTGASFIFCCGFLNSANAQFFWTESFNTGCNQGVFANNFISSNGQWTVANTGFNDLFANNWFISGTESGFAAGNCGNGCLVNTALNNQSLHVANVMGAPSVTCASGDCGAYYARGVGANDVRTSKIVYSPFIDCTGRSGITLEFNYIERGDTNLDNATVIYFDGVTFTTLFDMYKTSTQCGTTGYWTHFSYPLPPSADNNPSVYIGFEWKNNDDTQGSGPSFAVDDITLRSAPIPVVASFVVDSNNTCIGLPSQFTDLSIGDPTSWTWLFPNGVPSTSTAQHPSITYNVPGTFSVTLICSNSFSSDTVTGSITILACLPPVADFSGTPTIICQNRCVNFSDLSQNNPTSWQWSFPGSSTPTSNASNPLNVCYPISGINNVKLVVSNIYGSDSITKFSSIRVDSCPPPVANFNPSATITGCDTFCVNFFDASTSNPDRWQWSFPGGTPSSSSLQNPSGICYTADGLYDVMLIVGNGVGSDTLIRYSLINMVGIPGASISGSAFQDSIDFGGTDTLTVTGGTSYTWLPAPGLNADSSTNPVVVVSPTETTTYTCLIYDGFSNCTTVRTITVHIRHTKHVLFLPTAFSPNLDGTNDKFYIRGNDIFSARLVVFDRWGLKVFDTDDKNMGWDGTYEGEKVAMGAYTYVAYVVFGDGRKESKAGTIALIR